MDAIVSGMAALIVVIGGVVGIGLLIAVLSIWEGYVLSILWSWFMVPSFGAAPLSIPVAIGLAMIVGMLTHQSSNAKFSDVLAKGAFAPALTLLFGWIVTKFL